MVRYAGEIANRALMKKVDLAIITG